MKYTGPTITVRGSTLENGTPLRRLNPKSERKGATGGARYVAPDEIIRILPTSQIEER